MITASKSFREGTHRFVRPAETLARVAPFLPAMGITRIANVTGLDRLGIPVVNVIRPNSRSLSVSQGKGLTLAAAKASGVMEAIESYHAERIGLPVKAGSYQELVSGQALIDVEGLPVLKGTRFDRARQMSWIEGENLMDGGRLWLPFETVHTDYTLPKDPDAGCLVASTNGLASGNHRLEAIVHAICEVIERDANTLWAHLPVSKTAATRVDETTVDDPACRSVIDRLLDQDMAVGIWDMTSDTGVASFYCLIVDERFENGHSGGGAGTHPTREVALLRALTEAVQVRTNYITGARDDLAREEYRDNGIALKNRHARQLLEAQTARLIDFRTIPSRQFETFEEDIDWLLGCLKGIGTSQVIWVDLTTDPFDIPVVRIVIPGLEGPHDHDDYVPGRRMRTRLENGG